MSLVPNHSILVGRQVTYHKRQLRVGENLSENAKGDNIPSATFPQLIFILVNINEKP